MLRIKEILKEQGKTQIDLANDLSVTPIGLNKIINGNPTLETLKKIADVLKVELHELFSNKTSKENDLFIIKGGKQIHIGKIDLSNIQI